MPGLAACLLAATPAYVGVDCSLIKGVLSYT